MRRRPICLVIALLAMPIPLVAAPPLPVPRHDTLQDYQTACAKESGFVTFASQVDCVRQLINESTDRYVNKNDPTTQLYLLTATKLVGHVTAKRTSSAIARIELQKSLIEITAAQESARAAADRRSYQVLQATAETAARRQAESNARDNAANAQADERAAAQRRESDAEEQSRRIANDQQQAYAQQVTLAKRQDRANDVAYCIRTANARLDGFMTNIVQQRCAVDPNYYATLPDLHTTQVRVQ